MNSRLQLRCWLAAIYLLRAIFARVLDGVPDSVIEEVKPAREEIAKLCDELKAEIALQEKLFESSKSDTRTPS